MCSERIEGDPAMGDESPVDEGRRAAIAKMGVLAAPAFVVMLTTGASEAWSASGKPGKPKPKPKPKPPKPRGRIGGKFF